MKSGFFKQHPLFKVLAHGKGHKLHAFWASICSIINKLFDIAPEILIGIAIDVVINREDSFVAGMGITDPKTQLIVLAVLTFLIWLGESLFQFLHLILWRNLAQKIQHQFRLKAYNHIQHMDMSFFENQSSGKLTAILNDDVNQLERFLNVGANDILQVLTSVLSVGAIFFIISPKIALFAFTPIPLIIFGAFYFQNKAEPKYAKVREMAGQLASAINNNLLGIATIKSYTKEPAEFERISKISTEYSKANAEAIKISSAFIPIIRIAILTGFLATFVIGGLDALNGDLEVGAYGVLVFLTQRLLWPFTNLAVTMDLYQRGMASARRILKLIEQPVKTKEKPNAIGPMKTGNIVFNNLNFDYGNSQSFALKNINLEIKKGQSVAFVGQTGSGKTTIFKLLLRFYQPRSGSIFINNINIDDIRLSNLRASIALVSQDTYLFNGTVYDNIKYGNTHASSTEIIEAANLAEAHTFIEKMDQGYQSVIGEMGVKLSGGQKQRISLARAILKNPQILVLDEATSAVDNETEAAIQRSMKHIAKNRTIIIIAHRLSTIIHTDCIYVLDQGEIKESGSHQDLIHHNGIYKKLWTVQTGG